MLFSLEWLAEYVDLPPDVDEICRRLTDAGFNVEGRKETAGDVVLDVEITTNRSDCMNHVGLARELAVIFETELRQPSASSMGGEPLTDVPIEVEDFEHCSRYAARVVRGVTVGESPAWLMRRLESIGQRPINNVVDVTNFVLWELGQPLHAFDIEKLSGPSIRVRLAAQGEYLRTLDGEGHELDGETLVIADADGAVALAGVMGGLESEVSESTTEVLIESAHFEPQLVRRAARELGMQTDASHRFERGSDPEICLDAATRAADLIAEIAGGEVDEAVADVRDSSVDWRLHGAIDVERLNRFAGVDIPQARVVSVLQGLGYAPEEVSTGAWRVRVPPWRYYDCEAMKSDDPPSVWEADLYEEVMRHFGFNSIPSSLPAIGAPDEGSSSPHRLRESIRGRLAACGLTEVINYAFYDAAADQSLPALVGGSAISLVNPLSENYGLMRRSVLPGLVASALFNQRRGAEAVRIYEIGHVFGSGVPEFETVGMACGGTAGVPWDRTREWDLFAVKGVIEELIRAGGLNVVYQRVKGLPGLVEGAAAELVDDSSGDVVGFVGQLDSDEVTFPLFLAELRTRVLERAGEGAAVCAPSRYPGIQADATLTHSRDVAWTEIAEAIEATQVADLRQVGLKDRYSGQGVPTGAVNTTIFFRYNADDRSLTQDEVNQRHSELVRELEERFGWRS